MRDLVKELLLYYEELRRHLVHRLRDSDQAADLAQSSFEQVYASLQGKMPAHPTIESPRALLYRVARNLCIDAARHRQVAENWQQSQIITQAHAGTPTPEFLFAQKQIVERVIAELERLPPRRREVFLLFKAYGYTQAEIAQRLDITVMAVAKHVLRATLDCSQAFAELHGQLPVSTGDSAADAPQCAPRPALAEECC